MCELGDTWRIDGLSYPMLGKISALWSSPVVCWAPSRSSVYVEEAVVILVFARLSF